MNCLSLKRAMIGLLLIVVPFVRADEQEFRTFNSSDGREITACVVEYDANIGKVRLKTKGFKKAWIPISSLSSEDQAYVSAWYERHRFLSNDLFRIKLTEDAKGWKKHMGTQREKYTGYVISMTNLGDADLDPIRIVACEIRKKNGARTYDHFNLEASQLLAGETVEESKVLRSFKNPPRNILDSVVGVRMRVYWTCPDGRELMREVFAPKKLSAEKYPWKDPKVKLDAKGGERSLKISGSINNVSTEKTRHKTKKRGSYRAQTFEYTYSIGACKSYRIRSFFEFNDRHGVITFMSSGSHHSSGPKQQRTSHSILNIDAKEQGLKDVELNAYWIQIFAVDESGESHLVAEAHDGCSSLKELKERNESPIGV